ncbi:type III-B CRISPR module RAMP protein Cmr4 [Desulfobaculum senezii]
MKNCVIGMVAETAIHFGVGRSEGVVDLPIAREAATDFPVIYGSGLKGAFRQYVREGVASGESAVNEKDVFGDEKAESAGRLCFSDARILLYPVRCLTGAFVWITCRTVLERFKRDMQRFGKAVEFDVPSVKDGQAVTSFKADEGKVLIEDQLFNALQSKKLDPEADPLFSSFDMVIPVESVRSQLQERFVVLSDDDFAHFVRFGVPIVARNVLEEGTKKSKNLWYEEHLPADTVMYCGVTARNGNVNDFVSQFEVNPYVQVGGNATVGQGWFNMKCAGGE